MLKLDRRVEHVRQGSQLMFNVNVAHHQHNLGVELGIVVDNEWKNLVATQALVCLAGCLEVKAGEVMVILMELQLAEACGCETILVESNT